MEALKGIRPPREDAFLTTMAYPNDHIVTMKGSLIDSGFQIEPPLCSSQGEGELNLKGEKGDKEDHQS